ADAHNLGVLVVAQDRIYSARFIRKTNTHIPDAFAAPDTGPLGVISNGIPYIGSTPRRAHTTHSRFSLTADATLPAVDIIYDHPGAQLDFYNQCITAQRAGLVIAGKGNGNLSLTAQQGALKLHEAGIPVIRASQVSHGPDVPTEFASQSDPLPAHWWRPDGARILLSLCLSQELDRETTLHTVGHY